MQRQFDMENEQDVKDLFDILPDCVCRVEQARTPGYLILHYKGSHLDSLTSLFAIQWRSRHYADRPVDKSKWIGALCWFWDKKETRKVAGILVKINQEGSLPFVADSNLWRHCRPVKREEIKFVEDND